MSSTDQQRRRQQGSSQPDPSRRGPAQAPSSAPAPRRQAAPTSGSGPTSSGRPAPAPAARAPPASRDNDGPAPPPAPIDDYDRMEDSRDNEIAQHWERWYQRIEENYTYPVVINDDIANDIYRVLGSQPPQFSVQRKPRLGDGLGGQAMGNVRVVLLDGDSLDDVKDSFRGKKATVIINQAERSAFVPERLTSDAAAELANAPPPVPAPASSGQLPIRGGPSNPSPAPRKEERRSNNGNGSGNGSRG
ncbi:uncharacterized protein B0H64DRAFT_369837 [Chaetomium fimeti]|uniref:Uncharacterized protein n=1 Tax=Chaetomium fimeti TaxID=1854472 RepID=A0AAE0HPZ7_9PEZI|nr:hypothetical protein B0H64DRAFT_369837 [Chaetomium fimeti]